MTTLPVIASSNLNELEHMRLSIQRQRIQSGNRRSAVERGASQGGQELAAYLETWYAGIEEQLAGQIATAAFAHPAYDWLIRVKGIGPGLTASLLAHIDIERAPTISALWRYAGMGVVEGQAERRTVGEKLHYNNELKRVCYLIGTSMIRASSPYRAEYDEAKVRYETQRPDWTPAHRHHAARRKMVKLFLSHLWLVWRVKVGLPISQPYAFDLLHHGDWKSPRRYVPSYPYPETIP